MRDLKHPKRFSQSSPIQSSFQYNCENVYSNRPNAWTLLVDFPMALRLREKHLMQLVRSEDTRTWKAASQPFLNSKFEELLIDL